MNLQELKKKVAEAAFKNADVNSSAACSQAVDESLHLVLQTLRREVLCYFQAGDDPALYECIERTFIRYAETLGLKAL